MSSHLQIFGDVQVPCSQLFWQTGMQIVLFGDITNPSQHSSIGFFFSKTYKCNTHTIIHSNKTHIEYLQLNINKLLRYNSINNVFNKIKRNTKIIVHDKYTKNIIRKNKM